MHNIINWQNPDAVGRTPLHAACHSGYTNVVQILLEHASIGESVNKADDWGQTPLHSASFMCDTAVVQLLLSQPTIGESINKEHKWGGTPMAAACSGKGTATSEERVTVESLLRAKGARGEMDQEL